MLIGQASKSTGVSARSIRYYESRKLIESRRLSNGYRDYDLSALERIRIIKACINLGFDLGDAEHIVDCTAERYGGRPLCSDALGLFQKRLQEVERQIDVMESIRRRLETILKASGQEASL